MSRSQPGILADVPKAARFLRFHQRAGVNALTSLLRLAEQVDEHILVGIGASTAASCKSKIPRLRDHPQLLGAGGEVIPSTPGGLWLRISGDDLGEVLTRSRKIETLVADGYEVEDTVHSFMYREGRDLSGYEDGTENPVGDDATAAAIVPSQTKDAVEGLAGSSFVAVQKWQHDFSAFDAMGKKFQDEAIGRRIADNEEMADAPSSAHVKRTAQENFSPEAFVVRRSMPWASDDAAGLLFVAFGASFDAYEALLRRMIGCDDGVSDALFRFTRPLDGSYFWCPPLTTEGALDLRLLQSK